MYTYLTPSHLQDWAFSELMTYAGLDKHQAALAFHRSVCTIERWRSEPPDFAKTYLIFLSGRLGVIHPRWDGRRIDRTGLLWTTEGWSLNPGEIRSLPYLYALTAKLKKRLGEPSQLSPGLSNVTPLLPRRHTTEKRRSTKR